MCQRDISFIQSHIPQQATSAIAGADQTVAHLFPLQVNSSVNTVQLGSDISWSSLPRRRHERKLPARHERDELLAGVGDRVSADERSEVCDGIEQRVQSWTRDNPPLANADDWPKTEPRWWLLDAAARVETGCSRTR